MSRLVVLALLLASLVALGPAALVATAEDWPDGISDAEPDELAPAAHDAAAVIESVPCAGVFFAPPVVATILPVAAGAPPPPTLPVSRPRPPPAI